MITSQKKENDNKVKTEHKDHTHVTLLLPYPQYESCHFSTGERMRFFFLGSSLTSWFLKI